VVQFQFDIGVLPVEVHFSLGGRPERAVMTQAAPQFGAQLKAAEVAPCLGLAAADLFPQPAPQVVSTGVPFLMVPAQDLEVLKKAQMDRPRLRALLARAKVPAAFLFCLQGFDPGSDTHARFFDPDGTMEDPFTGSAAGGMGAYLVRHGLKSGPLLHIEQGHLLGRPGYGQLEVRGSAENIQGIKLSGSAVKTLEGTIL
jgi:trans-2,3-dihydro-3-hydroxyanthranilate isomerase